MLDIAKIDDDIIADDLSDPCDDEDNKPEPEHGDDGEGLKSIWADDEFLEDANDSWRDGGDLDI